MNSNQQQQIRKNQLDSRTGGGGFIDLLLRAASIIYYFLYFMFKGRENSCNEQQVLCLANKPATVASASNKAHDSVSPPPPPETNVCCLHGVQWRARELSDKEQEMARPVTPSIQSVARAAKSDGQRLIPTAVSTTTTALKNHFEKLSEKKTEFVTNGLFHKFFKSGKAVQSVREETSKPVVFECAEKNAAEMKSQPWLRRAFGYLSDLVASKIPAKRTQSKIAPETALQDGAPKISASVDSVVAKAAPPPVAPPAPPSMPSRPPPPAPPLLGPAGTKAAYVPRLGEPEPKYPAALFSDKAAAGVSMFREPPKSAVSPVATVASSEHLRPLKEIGSELKTIFASRKAYKPSEKEMEEEEEEEDLTTETDHIKRISQSRRGPVLQFAKPHDAYQTAPQRAQVTIRTVVDDDYQTSPRSRLEITTSPNHGDYGMTSSAVATATTTSRNYRTRELGHQRNESYPSYYDNNSRTRFVDSGSSSLSPVRVLEYPAQKQQYSKKYTRYTYRSSSSYHSADDTEQEERLLKKVRNPGGEVHDYQQLSKEYGDNSLMTNMASPEKCHELSHVLSSEQEHGKGVEMFHKRRQSAEDWIVHDKPPLPKSTATIPKKPIVDEIIDSVRDAAARKEDVFKPIEAQQQKHVLTGTDSNTFMEKQSSFAHHGSLTNLVDKVVSKPPSWEHGRLFSPVPFNAAPRPYTPTDFGRRSPTRAKADLVGGEFKPEAVTTSVIAITTPSTRIVTSVTQTSSPSSSLTGCSTFPRSWRSFSQAYKQHHAL